MSCPMLMTIAENTLEPPIKDPPRKQAIPIVVINFETSEKRTPSLQWFGSKVSFAYSGSTVLRIYHT